MAGAAIELRAVTKRFATPNGGIYTALHDLTMEVAPGEFCAVVGPTGCGKSTTLALISGLERPSAGEVAVMGKPVNGIPEGIGYVFQTDAVGDALDGAALHPDLAGAGQLQAGNQRQRRRLAAAGRPYHGAKLAGCHLERQVAQCGVDAAFGRSEPLGDATQLDRRPSHCRNRKWAGRPLNSLPEFATVVVVMVAAFGRDDGIR